MILPELGLLMDPHILWVLEAQSGQIFDRLGLSGREEKGLPCFRKVLNNGIECVGETHVQNSVGFIKYYHGRESMPCYLK